MGGGGGGPFTHTCTPLMILSLSVSLSVRPPPPPLACSCNFLQIFHKKKMFSVFVFSCTPFHFTCGGRHFNALYIYTSNLARCYLVFLQYAIDRDIFTLLPLSFISVK